MSRSAVIAGIVIAIIVIGAAFLLAGRGGKTTTTSPTTSPTTTQTSAATPTSTTTPTATTTTQAKTTAAKTVAGLKGRNAVCVVYDIGGRGDLGFNDMAYMGASKAAKDFGLKLIQVQSTSENDYLPNLRTLARSKKCVLIVAVGFLMTDAVKTVSKEFPDQMFAIVDGYVPNRPNVLSILFKEQEGSALAGALAAMVAHYFGYKAVGVVLGMEIPPLYKFEAGYYWGIRYGEKMYEEHTGKKIQPLRILYTYTGSFNDPAKGKQAAEAQLAEGAGVIYNVAGATGLGIFDAVYEYATKQGKTMGPPFAIGVDSDQDWIKPGFIIASMMKRVDVGVYKATEKALKYYKGEIKSFGGVMLLGLKEHGVGLSRLEDLKTFLKLAVEEKKIKPSEEKEIYQKVKEMREKIPKWIWDSVYGLADKLINNPDISVYGIKWSQIEDFAKNPTAPGIQKIRKALKVG